MHVSVRGPSWKQNSESETEWVYLKVLVHGIVGLVTRNLQGPVGRLETLLQS